MVMNFPCRVRNHAEYTQLLLAHVDNENSLEQKYRDDKFSSVRLTVEDLTHEIEPLLTRTLINSVIFVNEISLNFKFSVWSVLVRFKFEKVVFQ